MPRVKQELEFSIGSSPTILYDYISNNSNLTQWFCNDLKAIDRANYIFFWDNEERHATMDKNLKSKTVTIIWKDAPAEEYLSFMIMIDDLTRDVAIKIIDFVEEEELSFNEKVWASDVETLRSAVGAH